MLNCSLLILPEFYSFLLQPSSFASDVTTCYSVVVLDPRYMHGSLFLNKNVSSGCMSFFPALFPHHFGDLNTVDSHSLWFRKVTVKCCTQYAAKISVTWCLLGSDRTLPSGLASSWPCGLRGVLDLSKLWLLHYLL